MIKFLEHNKLYIILFHVILGIIGFLIPIVLKITFLVLIALALFDIYKSKNTSEQAFLWSAYFVGAEVFIRMIKATFFYETGKYSVFLFLLLGILLNKKKYTFSFTFYFYIFLLLIGIFFTQVPPGESIRNAIMFNLSGPLVLGITAMYFFKREIQLNTLMLVLYLIILPLISMLVFLYIKTPSIEEILFGTSANFIASGGFGPNQVATAIGLAIYILTVFIILKKRLTNYLFIDALILAYFIYRGLLTFSRGGMLTGLIAVIVFIFFYILYQKATAKYFLRYLFVGGVFSLGIWLYTSNITGGMLINRYAGRNVRGEVKEDVTSGRIKIFETQLESFYKNPIFGIGIGSGKFKRKKEYSGITAASHNELTRLIEEHGSIGVLILLILFIEPLINMYHSNNFQRAFLLSFFLLWFLTINHSAMRIAFPSFIYGLSLIKIRLDEA